MATQRVAVRATEENEPVLREGKPQANMQAGQGEPRRRYSEGKHAPLSGPPLSSR